RAHQPVERLRALEVAAERLLDDDPHPWSLSWIVESGCEAALREVEQRGFVEGRRQGKVEETTPPRVAGRGALELLQALAHFDIRRQRVEVAAEIAQAIRKARPGLCVQRGSGACLDDRLTHGVAESAIAHLAAANAYD